MSFLTPTPEMAVFLMLKTTACPAILAFLALARSLGGRGAARLPALAALALALAALIATYGPALSIPQNSAYRLTAQIVARNGGMSVLLLTFALLGLSSCFKQARGRWIDITGMSTLLMFSGFWWAIS